MGDSSILFSKLALTLHGLFLLSELMFELWTIFEHLYLCLLKDGMLFLIFQKKYTHILIYVLLPGKIHNYLSYWKISMRIRFICQRMLKMNQKMFIQNINTISKYQTFFCSNFLLYISLICLMKFLCFCLLYWGWA